MYLSIAQRRRRFRTLALFAGIALPALVAELASHLVPSRWRDVVLEIGGTWHVPGGECVYRGALLSQPQPRENRFRWNGAGEYDYEHELPKPAGTKRVLVLGDSFVEAVQVPLADHVHVRLGKALGWESIAIGRSGWGQVQELEALRQRGLAYSPDVVVVEFFPGNDVRNNSLLLEAASAGRPRSSWIAARRAGLVLPAILLDKLSGPSPEPFDNDVFREHPRHDAGLWADGWSRTFGALAQIRAETERAGAQLVVVVFPGAEPPVDGDAGLPARRIGLWCFGNGMRCLDLEPVFGRRPSLFVPNDGHWSSEGHALAAREIAAFCY